MFQNFNKSPIETIGVDRGRDSLKAYGENGELIFPSVVGEWHKRNINSSSKNKEDNEYDVVVDNEKFFIGNLALKSSTYPIRNINADKINSETKTLTLVAVALLCTHIDPRISLTVSLPIDDYNEENQERIISMLKGQHTVAINQGKKINMNIEKVYVAPEGLALMYYMTLDNQGREIENYIAENFRILDAGSMTHNLGSFRNGSLVDKKNATFTIKKGLYYVTGGERKPEELETKNFVRMLMTGEVALKWSDYDCDKEIVYGTGGSMYHEEKYLKEYLPSLKVIDNPLFGTAIGCFRLGMYLCNQNV